VQGTGDQGQPLYQAYQVSVNPDQPLAGVPPASGSPSPSSPERHQIQNGTPGPDGLPSPLTAPWAVSGWT
jgi:hypothetical protein